LLRLPARGSIAAQRICTIPFPDSSTNPTHVRRDFTEVERLAQQLWSSSLLETVVKRESAVEMGKDFTLRVGATWNFCSHEQNRSSSRSSACTSRAGLRVVLEPLRHYGMTTKWKCIQLRIRVSCSDRKFRLVVKPRHQQ
jgi:hypothetical protein